MHPHRKHHEQMALALQNLISTRPGPKPVCAILNTMMGWSTEVFAKFHIPTVAFFTSGACSAAIERSTTTISGPKKMGPPKLGNQPPWVEEVEGVIALLINTCDDLESPFIRYLSDQIGKLVWGVGPLCPNSIGSQQQQAHFFTTMNFVPTTGSQMLPKTR
uniref:Uncharacterized protein n=1 Tax=Quercus lobata TaxID=97700 RepID=A0A7N2LSA5_QUELO